VHPDWIRGLRDQCQAASVPFFFKQWGEWRPTNGYTGPMHRLHTWSEPRHQYMEKVGKGAAGAQLDGREHREFPS